MELNQEINGMGSFSMPICKRTVNSDLSEDFTLPDYYPEIRRVLCVRENLLPLSKFVNGSKLDVSGVVDYTLIYVSHDGKLSSAPLSAEYDMNVTLDGINDYESSEGLCVMAYSSCDGSSVRVVSPRKLQIRSKLKTSVCAYGKKLCMESLEGIENEASVQYLKGEAENADIFCETSDLITLEDEYTLTNPNSRIAMSEGQIFVENASGDGEIIRLSGYALLKLLVCNDEKGSCEAVLRKLPFDAECELDGASLEDGRYIRADGFVSDISVSTEDGKAKSEMNLILQVCVAQNKKVGYTKDVYSTEQKCECVFETQTAPTVIQNKAFNFGISERVPKSETSIPENAQIIDALAFPAIEAVEAENGKYIIRGSCKYNMICSADGDYSLSEIKLPFKYECEGKEEMTAYDVSISPLSCKARLDGDFVTVEAELAGAATVMGENEVRVLKKAVFKDGVNDGESRWRVCYIQSGEGLWDIAKRYSVKEDSIKGDTTKDRFILIEG